MKHPEHRPHAFVALLALTVALAACSSSGGDGDRSPPPPAGEITLDPNTAPAASMVKVEGLELDACPLRTSEIRIAGETAPTVLNARHEALMRLPLFYDEGTKWAAPPTGPQDVEIFCNGDLWATLPAAITITELAPAAGTTEALVTDYQQIAADYQALVNHLFPTPSIEQQLFTAIFAAVDELLNGSNAESLSTVVDELKQTDPEVLAVMDAVTAVGSADEAVTAQRELLAEMRAHAESSPAPSLNRSALVVPKAYVPEIPGARLKSDVDLASEMQTYVVLKSFGEEVVGQTREDFSSGEGVLSAISEKFGRAAKVSVYLFIIDYVLNKLVVSVFPANLDEIQLELAETKLQSSEVTYSQFKLSASNVPANFTIRDLTAVVQTLLGAGGGGSKPAETQKWIKSLEDLIPEVAKLALDLLDQTFKEYAALLPNPLEYDLELFSVVPQMHYEAWGETRDLYALYPTDSNVIRPLEDQLEWAASPTYWGSAQVYVTPAPAPAPSFWGSLYSGPAFGDNTTFSNPVEVTVGDLAIVLELYDLTVPEGDTASVGVKLSHAPQAEEGDVDVFVWPSGDPDISVTSTVPMSFNDTNWNDFQYLTLAAAEDDDEDDGQATVLLTALLESVGEDPINIEAHLTATEEDNDRTKFVLDPSSVDVPEGETAEVDVKLNQEPSSKVTAIVTYASGDQDIEVRSPTVMRFDEDNWDIYQTVTLYAQPDEDLEEGRAQFLVSANPPATVDDAYITATEDEEGDMLHYSWTIDDGETKYTAGGVIPITLDPTADSETVLGTATGYATRTQGEDYRSGTSTLTVRNYWTDTVCYCGTTHCVTRTDPADHILAVDTQLNISTAPASQKQGARRDIVVIVGEDDAFSYSYDCGAVGTISAELL